MNFIPKENIQKLIDKLNKMSDDSELDALITPNSKDDKSKDQEEPAAPTGEEALRKQIAALEAELARLKEELQKFQSTDNIIKALRTAHPHLASLDSFSRDAQLELYESDKKAGILIDDQSLYDESVRQNELLIADALQNLTTKLINVSKGCKVPFHEGSIIDMITDWKKSNGVVDDFKVIDFLKNKINDVINLLPNTTGDALKKKYGIPNITQDIDTSIPYNSSTMFSADGSKYNNKNGGNE